MSDLLESAGAAVELARSTGAQDVSARATRSRDIDFSMRQGMLETVRESTSNGLSIEFYVDGRYGNSSTNDLRPDRLAEFVRDAVALTRALEVDPHRKLPDPVLYEGVFSGDLEIYDSAVAAVTREQRLAWLEEMNVLLRDEAGAVSAESGVNDGHSMSAGVSSNGFSGETESSYLWMGSSLTLKDAEDKLNESWMWGGARNLSDLPSPKELAALTLKRGRDREGSVKGPTRRTTMIIDPSTAPRLIGRLLSGAGGRAMDRDQSFWKNRVGTKAVSEKLTVIDDPLVPRGLSSRYFDGEGIAARPLPMIESGVFQNLYLSSYYARKLEMDVTTGSGSNRIVMPGEKDLAALVAEAGEGIYVTSWLGGNADGTTGDYSFGLRGHLIENGEIGAPVGEMNVTGNLLTLFSQLVAVGNDPWPFSPIQCPTLVFEGVDFSGA